MARLALCLVLQEVGGPIDPGFGNIIGGPHPDQGLPGSGAYPDQGLPGGSGGHPWFPGHLSGPRPDQGLPGSGARPDQGLPRPPGSVNLPTHPIYHPDKPVPPGQSPGAGVWVVAYVPGKGFEWVAVTPGVPEKPVPAPVPPGTPTTPPVIDNTLPQTPQPKK